MSGAWVTQMKHFLDDRGQIPPGGERPLVRFLGAIVSAAARMSSDRDCRLGVRCRRRPSHQRCPGDIRGRLQSVSGEIYWLCPVCGDHGVISSWEETPWDPRCRPEGESLPSAITDDRDKADTAVLRGAALRVWEKVPPSQRVRILNNVWCVNCHRGGAMSLTGGHVARHGLVLSGRCVCCGGEVAPVVEVSG